MNDPRLSDVRLAQADQRDDLAPSPGVTRRDLVRQGIKIAFVAPVVTTFFARDAVAAGSNHSCYPQGHACSTGGNAEPCCDGLSCQFQGVDVDTMQNIYECQP